MMRARLCAPRAAASPTPASACTRRTQAAAWRPALVDRRMQRAHMATASMALVCTREQAPCTRDTESRAAVCRSGALEPMAAPASSARHRSASPDTRVTGSSEAAFPTEPVAATQSAAG